MPSGIKIKIIAALLIGLFLCTPHAALAQEPNEAATLTQQIIQLYKQGRYSEAIPLAQRLLTISEPLGPDHPDVANSLNILGARCDCKIEVFRSGCDKRIHPDDFSIFCQKRSSRATWINWGLRLNDGRHVFAIVRSSDHS
jgi:hypothetical protein